MTDMPGIMMLGKDGKKWLIVLIVGGVLWPGVAYQQVPFVGCNPTQVFVNGEPFITNQCTFADLLAVPVKVYNWLMWAAGFVFFSVVVWGGARMMMFYASEAPETELNNAKLTIRRGIVGLFIIAFSWLIVNILVYRFFGLIPGSGVGQWLASFGLTGGGF
jgi:hypothetical protein